MTQKLKYKFKSFNPWMKASLYALHSVQYTIFSLYRLLEATQTNLVDKQKCMLTKVQILPLISSVQCLFYTQFPINYCNNPSGTASDFNYSCTQLHLGTFMSYAFSHTPWQCQNGFGKGHSSKIKVMQHLRMP